MKSLYIIQQYIKLLRKFMTQLQNVPIPDLYKQVHHITSHGIQGYKIQKVYQDPIEMIKSRQLSSGKFPMKKHQTKRGGYLQDQAKLHKNVPGPGKYALKDQWLKKSKSLHNQSKKMTYIEQIMKKEKKQKKPAPGYYNVFKSLKQLDAQNKKLAQKKIKIPDRISYLDHVQYEANLTPGIGNYNPRERIKTQGSKIRTKPQEWRQKHKQEDKKNKKPKKLPDMGTYHPLPSSYEIFDSMKEQKSHKNLLGNVERFKLPKAGSGLGPGKYVPIQKWFGKQTRQKQRHGLQSITKGTSKSVYYH